MRQAFACWSREGIRIGPVSLQAVKVLQILFKRDVSFMVVADLDQPFGAWHEPQLGSNLAILKDFFDAAITTERIDAGIRGILQDA